MPGSTTAQRVPSASRPAAPRATTNPVGIHETAGSATIPRAAAWTSSSTRAASPRREIRAAPTRAQASPHSGAFSRCSFSCPSISGDGIWADADAANARTSANGDNFRPTGRRIRDATPGAARRRRRNRRSQAPTSSSTRQRRTQPGESARMRTVCEGATGPPPIRAFRYRNPNPESPVPTGRRPPGRGRRRPWPPCRVPPLARIASMALASAEPTSSPSKPSLAWILSITLFCIAGEGALASFATPTERVSVDAAFSFPLFHRGCRRLHLPGSEPMARASDAPRFDKHRMHRLARLLDGERDERHHEARGGEHRPDPRNALRARSRELRGHHAPDKKCHGQMHPPARTDPVVPTHHEEGAAPDADPKAREAPEQGRAEDDQEDGPEVPFRGPGPVGRPRPQQVEQSPSRPPDAPPCVPKNIPTPWAWPAKALHGPSFQRESKATSCAPGGKRKPLFGRIDPGQDHAFAVDRRAPPDATEPPRKGAADAARRPSSDRTRWLHRRRSPPTRNARASS